VESEGIEPSSKQAMK